jgi:periplasmic copper chaperone A
MMFRQIQIRKMAAVLCVLAASVSAAAAQSVKITNAWVRPTAPGQTSAGAYMELTSEPPAALVAAGSAVAGRAELHSMSMEGGIMRMRALPRVELPAGQTVKLAPGGMHLMLLDLKQPLKTGDKVPLVLTIQSSGTSITTVKVEAEVKAGPADAHKH